MYCLGTKSIKIMLFNPYCFSLDVTEDLPEWHALFKEDNKNIYLVMVAGIWSGLKILSTFRDVILTNQHQIIKAK